MACEHWGVREMFGRMRLFSKVFLNIQIQDLKLIDKWRHSLSENILLEVLASNNVRKPCLKQVPKWVSFFSWIQSLKCHMKTTIQTDFALTELRPSFDPDVVTSVFVFATVGIEGLEMQPPSWSSESLVRMLADLYWCILWAVVAGRITCFFATISEMSHEDNNTIWLCPYWATTLLWPWCWHECLLCLQRLEVRVLKCSLQVGRLRVWSGCLLMYIDVSCEQL